MTTATANRKTTKSRVEVEIIRSTAKAHLVRAADGREGWIQRRWLAADGTVGEGTMDRADASRQAAARKREAEKAERVWRDSLHLVRIARQTEKAIAVSAPFEFAGDVDETLLWFPKSQCQPGEERGTAFVPGWLIAAKIDEKCEGTGGRSDYYARHRYAKGERGFINRDAIVISDAT